VADKPEAQQAVYDNLGRIGGEHGKALLRRRGEFLECSFVHAGGLRRAHLRGREYILDRVLIHIGGFNLSLVMRQLLGKGTGGVCSEPRPRSCSRAWSGTMRRFRRQAHPKSAVNSRPPRGRVLKTLVLPRAASRHELLQPAFRGGMGRKDPPNHDFNTGCRIRFALRPLLPSSASRRARRAVGYLRHYQ